MIAFLDSGREPRVAPHPDFPEGMDIIDGPVAARLPHPEGLKITEADVGPSCLFDLPYPSPRCGLLVVDCERCGKRIALTVAGRVDDPRTLRMSCTESPVRVLAAGRSLR